MTQVLPVIHHIDNETALQEAKLAYESGADGIFLISHNGTNSLLPELGKKIKAQYPKFKVGLNLLGEPIMHAAHITKENNLDMVWGDSCGVSSLGLTNEGQQLSDWAKENPEVEVFAAVAFKYQRVEHDPKLAAQNAKNAGFIPTTSGSGTGHAPSVDKIKNMSDDLLAVASGMDCDNVKEFAPYLSHILVATGVSIDDHHFDEEKLYKFIKIVQAA